MSQTSALPTYSTIYAFGDSLSDGGNLSNIPGALGSPEPVSPPYFKETYGSSSGNVFSNGPTWVQDLSIALGLGTLKPSLLGGTDFAYGGADTGSTPQNAGMPEIQALSLPAQFTQFQLAEPTPAPNALYTISIGANDLNEILDTSGLSAAQQATDVDDAVANEISFVKSLVKDGAKNLLVLDVPDLGKTPDTTSGTVNGSNTPSATLDAEASQLASQYNTTLAGQLATIASTDGINASVVDAYTLLDNAIADPAAYGFTNVTTPVWSGNYVLANSGTLAATGAAAQDQYLFFDHLHPTEAGHQAIADLAEQDLSGKPVLTVDDTTTGQPVAATGTVYNGPIAGPVQDYINITPDNLNITATTPNWFLQGGTGENALAVTSGTNVLESSGSAFMTGGSGADTFDIDDHAVTAASWSTIVNFHAGDTATLVGVSASDFTLSWLAGEGAPGATGLTLFAEAAGKPVIALTFAGFTQPELTNGSLSVAAGTDTATGSADLIFHTTV